MISLHACRRSPATWSSHHKFDVWLEVELAACDAMERAGLRPVVVRVCVKRLALVPARIDEIERTTKHDVIAFLTHVEEARRLDARWLHRDDLDDPR